MKTQYPYHGPSTISHVQDDILEYTLRRFMVSAPTIQPTGHQLARDNPE